MDYYSILGVARNASPDDIKRAYRKQAMANHPDRTGGDDAKFKDIQEAYSVLSDTSKRDTYDHPQHANPFGNQQQGRNPFEGSPFANMFGQGFGQQQRQTPRNRDITVQADIGLVDVLNGKNLIIQYRLSSGHVETVNVDVPVGAKHGDTIQYGGLGDNGHPGIQRGNLLVQVRVKKSKHWGREDDNLIVRKVINVFDLLTGCVIIITTIDNKQLELKIPQGTKPGTKFNIPGYGLPNMQSVKRGNMYVAIDVEMPTITDEDMLEKIHQLKNEIQQRT